ncbi:MAG: hypothetical protein HXY50_12770 [Ignavibacteriaceae bacterium]|nr:hypothetical protein [Ignavibacteriaceae bacterium]
MRRMIVFVCLFTGWINLSFSQENQYPNVNLPLSIVEGIPSGWILTGSNPRDYEVKQDNIEPYSGYFSTSLSSVVNRPQGYVTLMQTIKADKYKGERISFSGYVKAKLVSDWAALWMRVDDVLGRPLCLDNMSNRPIVGTSDWVKYEVVLEVPTNGSEISFGVLLDGKGQIWFDEFQLKVVGPEIPITDQLKYKFEQLEPYNLDFEH